METKDEKMSFQIVGNRVVIPEGFDKIKKKSFNNKLLIRHESGKFCLSSIPRRNKSCQSE